MRFNANGSLDTGYGNNGTRTLTTAISALFENAGSIYIDGNAHGNFSNRTFYKLTNELAGMATSTNYGTGSVYQNNGEFFIDKKDFNTHELSKFDANLSPVLGFGTNGKVSLSSQLYVYEILFQTGGSIIL
ncbi:hypothetical protein [Chryseobacterium sp.]|uniref:hypothetical protein n=1 Tax=Chryseobacterium sp. TaxID=1871047 RepID=UPI0028A21FAF|nr:hypothetical protein [Chryseobacterium sp.]